MGWFYVWEHAIGTTSETEQGDRLILYETASTVYPTMVSPVNTLSQEKTNPHSAAASASLLQTGNALSQKPYHARLLALRARIHKRGHIGNQTTEQLC
jgi:hypothetical protein